jgi:acetyl esterase/lipase
VPTLTSAALDHMWSTYLGEPAHSCSPLAAPSHATSLASLPPALVLTVEGDPTRDEAEEYARALADAGVPTVLRRFDGLIHATFGMSGAVPRAAELHEALVAYLQQRFAETAPIETRSLKAA